MATNEEEVKQAARAELARRELQRRNVGVGTRAAEMFAGTVNSLGQGATFNFGDELGSALKATIVAPFSKKTWDEVYGEELSSIRQQLEKDKETTPALLRAAGGIGGGFLTGAGLAKSGISLLKGATSIPSAIGRGAVEGAAYGALSGAGAGENTEERVKGALTSGATGAVTGGLLSGTAAALMGRQRVPELDELFQAKEAAYNAAEQSGVAIRQNVAQRAVQNIRKKMADAGLDAMLHPSTTRALARISEDVDAGDLSLRQSDTLRKIINDAAKSDSAQERRVASILKDSFDDFVNGLKAADVNGPDPKFAIDALNTGRRLYRQHENGELIKELLERADIRSQQYSASGYENAVRAEFRNFALNRAAMRKFSPIEREAIVRVSRGGSTRANLTNLFRLIGKMAPRGPVSAVPTAIATAGGFAAGGPSGAALAGAGVMGGAEAARGLATLLTSRNAQLASEMMRRGGPAPSLGLGPVMSGLTAAGAQQIPDDDPNRRLAEMLLRERQGR